MVLTSYDVCSIFLGLGTMFVWIRVIRYMGYFKKYNASYPYFFSCPSSESIINIYMPYVVTMFR
jgi:phosphate/sulfate permease